MSKDRKKPQGAGTPAPSQTSPQPKSTSSPADGSAQNHKRAVLLHQESLTTHLGPIPPASDLEQYDRVVPGLAETIVRWADQEIGHRQDMEKAVTQAEIDHLKASDEDARLGLWLGFIVAIALIGVSAILAWQEKTWAAVGISGGTLVGLVSVFVYGSQKKRITKKKSVPTDQRAPVPPKTNPA